MNLKAWAIYHILLETQNCRWTINPFTGNLVLKEQRALTPAAGLPPYPIFDAGAVKGMVAWQLQKPETPKMIVTAISNLTMITILLLVFFGSCYVHHIVVSITIFSF